MLCAMLKEHLILLRKHGRLIGNKAGLVWRLQFYYNSAKVQQWIRHCIKTDKRFPSMIMIFLKQIFALVTEERKTVKAR